MREQNNEQTQSPYRTVWLEVLKVGIPIIAAGGVFYATVQVLSVRLGACEAHTARMQDRIDGIAAQIGDGRLSAAELQRKHEVLESRVLLTLDQLQKDVTEVKSILKKPN